MSPGSADAAEVYLPRAGQKLLRKHLGGASHYPPPGMGEILLEKTEELEFSTGVSPAEPAPSSSRGSERDPAP